MSFASAFWGPEFFVELRYGHLFIMGTGIGLALKDYDNREADRHTNYLDGWVMGLMISMVSGLLVSFLSMQYVKNFSNVRHKF